ncbi:MAG: LON peptidase substrate-binding domain-containing protein, partial [Anaerolineales bacterium]|nr:LON peptidase substrate-binding domain-containing protein [Anaerolineales bacterium]
MSATKTSFVFSLPRFLSEEPEIDPAEMVALLMQPPHLETPAKEGSAEASRAAGELAIPETLAILPLRGVVVYPLTAVPLTVGQPRSIRLVDDAVVGQRVIGLVASKNPELETPGPDDLWRVGTAAVVHRLFRAPDGTIRLLVQGLARFRLEEFVAQEPYLKARVSLIPETAED